MVSDTAVRSADTRDSREQELIWTARQHPNELVIPDVHPTRFPGTWVTIFEGTIPNDQRNALWLEGYSLYRIRMIGDEKAQVIIREDSHPDSGGDTHHEPTIDRYNQYDPYRERSYLEDE